MPRDSKKDYEISEDYCFVCKDGGNLRVCDHKRCLKAYHPQCVGQGADFLEADDRWTCGWHLCSCKKASTFQCFCCPSSFCHSCVKSADFVRVKKKRKGFCNNCLKLAKMIEEKRSVDSDGEEVDFDNTETFEFLFKDYWAIVKNHENLTLVDVQTADAHLKRGENFQSGSDSDKLFEESDDLQDACDDAKSPFGCLGGKRSRMKPPVKKFKKERTFTSWASEELREFLSSIGKYTEQPQSQLDVTEVVKEYVQSNNLFEQNKKKRNIVVCNEKLRKLFRKKRLKHHKIYDLLKNHLEEEHSDLNDEFPFSSEEDEGADSSKKKRRTISGYKVHSIDADLGRKKVLGPSKSSYAAIVVDNIKLAYMRKSLIMELLKNPETFESKVVGCFVKVKSDPKDIYYLARKEYELGQVTGIKKSPQAYKLGETSSDVILCVSNFSNDIHISNLSNDDIEQEECEDLRQLVKKGLYKQPTIAELETKIKSVYEDIMNHWIGREIVRLPKQIDRANMKGWRKELNEYLEKLQLLRDRNEQLRLLKEIPEVIADTETDIELNACEPLFIEGVNKGALASATVIESPVEETRGIVAAADEVVADEKNNGIEDMACEEVSERIHEGDETMAMVSQEHSASSDKVPEKMQGGNEDMTCEKDADFHEKVPERTHEGNEDMSCEKDADFREKIRERTHEEIELLSKCPSNQVIEIDDAEEDLGDKKASQIEVIDLDEDDEDMADVSRGNGLPTPDSSDETVQDITDVSRTNCPATADALKEMVQNMADVSRANGPATADASEEVVLQDMADVTIASGPATADASEIKQKSVDVSRANGPTAADTLEEIAQVGTRETPQIQKWCYVDPSGNEQGPYPLAAFRIWKDNGYLDDDFKVWKSGQCKEDAILLTVAFSLESP